MKKIAIVLVIGNSAYDERLWSAVRHVFAVSSKLSSGWRRFLRPNTTASQDLSVRSQVRLAVIFS